MKNGQKNFKNSIFSKVLKLFTHGMGCFGTSLGMLFHLYKGLLVTHKLFEKIEQKNKKLLFLACGEGPYWEWTRKQFFCCFFDFLKDFVCDEQTFIEVKQHPQAGPETTHTMCEKFEDFWKNQMFEKKLIIFYGGPPHNC